MDDSHSDELWLAGLLAETGPEITDLLAETLGIDLDEES